MPGNIMTSHVHLIVSTETIKDTDERKRLEDIIRDMKSFTSRSIRDLLKIKKRLEKAEENGCIG